MLFWLFVILLVVGMLMLALSDYLLDELGGGIAALGLIGILICGTIMIFGHANVDGRVAENKAIYDSLVYQYENNIYDNDNDLGKKELMNEIKEWNKDLAWYQEAQDDFWLGIFIPNVYDQFEFIEY